MIEWVVGKQRCLPTSADVALRIACQCPGMVCSALSNS
jgi:hypothetical protein